LRHVRQERVGNIGVGDGRFGKGTGDGPATSVSAIRKVFAIKEFFASNEALAIRTRPEFVAVQAGGRHGRIFSSRVARGSL
jgi:hypothetical protein